MKIANHQQIFLADLPTPLECLDNLSRQCGAKIYVKREDLTGHGFGGNKERMLDFIMAEALKKKAKSVVTVGSLQSNHCRLVAVFCNKFNIKAELILIKDKALKDKTNYLFCKLLGANIHLVEKNDVKNAISKIINRLQSKGERPYFIEGGGHNVLGALSYVNALKELKGQTDKLGISPKHLFLPVGTGTTYAGLLLGKEIFNYDIEIIGISIARKKEKCINEIDSLINQTKKYLRINKDGLDKKIIINDNYIGEGYGISTARSKRAIKLLAEQEGLFIDPVYNAKAVGGMLDIILKEKLKGAMIYLNTGGLPICYNK